MIAESSSFELIIRFRPVGADVAFRAGCVKRRVNPDFVIGTGRFGRSCGAG